MIDRKVLASSSALKLRKKEKRYNVRINKNDMNFEEQKEESFMYRL